jgi:6-phosphogluconolactonase
MNRRIGARPEKLWLMLVLIAAMAGCGGGGQPGQTLPGPAPTGSEPTVIGFVANANDNTVTSFLLNEETGALSAGATAATGESPSVPAVTPDRRFLFVSNLYGKTISRFVLDGNGGMQSAGAAVHLATPEAQPTDLAVSPSGKFLFVGTTRNAVEVFSIDSTSGNLQPIPNSPFTVTAEGIALSVTHSGQLLYAGNNLDAIYLFAIDSTTGTLTQLPTGPVHTGFAMSGMAVDPSDKYLFVSTAHAEKLLVYDILPSGALQQSASSGLASGYLTGGPAVTPNGRFVYMPDPFSSNGILAYSIDAASGLVTPVAGSPFMDRLGPFSVTISPNSRILVTARIDPGHIASYRIDPETGVLSPITGSAFDSGLPTGNSPNNVLLVPR